MTRGGLVWIERALMGLGLAAFWPWVLGYRGIGYLCALMAVLIGLGVVAVARVRRVRREFEQIVPLDNGKPPQHPGTE